MNLGVDLVEGRIGWVLGMLRASGVWSCILVIWFVCMLILLSA